MTEHGLAYGHFLESAHVAELNRKSALEARAASLITTSSGIVTILAAVGLLTENEELPSVSFCLKLTLIVALLAFVLASLSGLIASRLVSYEAPGPESLRTLVHDHWKDPDGEARREVADSHLRAIVVLHEVNRKKAGWAHAGWICQIAAVVLLAIVVISVIATRLQ